VGAAVLCKETRQPVVPTATNVGVFWPRQGIYRKPGLAVLEFLPALQPNASADMNAAAFTAKLEEIIEPASNVLMEEAGFTLPV
jgi:1-acyl-sn-glycerol-3-phosphate acyltransferase